MGVEIAQIDDIHAVRYHEALVERLHNQPLPCYRFFVNK
jgi:hypothetical protein